MKYQKLDGRNEISVTFWKFVCSRCTGCRQAVSSMQPGRRSWRHVHWTWCVDAVRKLRRGARCRSKPWMWRRSWFDYSSQVLGTRSDDNSVHQHNQFILYSPAERQPVKLNQAVSYVVARPKFENQPSCGILDTLLNTEGGLWRDTFRILQ